VEELRVRFPDSEIHLMPPIGEDPLFHSLIQTVAAKVPHGERS
jgi:hypothetical protein